MLFPIFAFVSCLMITEAMATVVFVQFNLTVFGEYTSKQHVTYITIATILAALLTAFISSQIQFLFLKQLDWDLDRNGIRKKTVGFQVLNGRWRSILRIGGLDERLQNYPVGISYIITSLITTAVVASFSPYPTARHFPWAPKIPSGPQACARTYPTTVNFTEGESYSWDMSNGTKFIVLTGTSRCPTRLAMKLAAMINPLKPNEFAYANVGVAIRANAVGAPFTLYYPTRMVSVEFLELLERYGSSAVSTNQCVPVMIKNPITCHRCGTVFPESKMIRVTSENELCNHNASFPLANPLLDNVMAKKMCTHGAVGQGTMVFGATGIYAKYLANSVGNKTQGTNSTYAISCSVNVRDIFEFRDVKLRFLVPDDYFGPGYWYARVLEGGEKCTPVNTVDDAYFGITAAANWQLLSQNEGTSGCKSSILSPPKSLMLLKRFLTN